MLKIAWTDIYDHPLPLKHRFPMEKYSLIPQQLRYEGIVNADNFFQPEKIKEEYILSVHTKEYWSRLQGLKLTKSEERKTGFPLSDKLVDRELIISQGTIDCAHFALEYGIAFNVAGGTHHAYIDRGEGFCLLNDNAICSRYLLNEGLAEKILIVDLDVHQGNGTAKIFEEENRVFTFSMHGEKNYPLKKEHSDLDIGLPDGTRDKEYLSKLEVALNDIFESFKPDFVLYQSGVDVLETDKLGRLSLSKEGCKERDKMVLKKSYESNLPVVVTMGGGYSEKIADIVDAHCNTYKLAKEIFF